MIFSEITCDMADKLRRIFEKCDYALNDYSLCTNLMWRDYYKLRIAFASGCMIIKGEYDGEERFNFPVQCEDGGSVENALNEIEKYCMERYIPLKYYAVPAKHLPMLTARYRGVRFFADPKLDEYVYTSESLINFVGKQYAGQRNHVKKFYSLYPNAFFRRLTAEDTGLLAEFLSEFEKQRAKPSEYSRYELAGAERVLLGDCSWAFVGCMINEGKIISVSLGERCGNQIIVHIEKALVEYEGLYPATVQAFAKLFCGDAEFINREEDSGDPGLRRSKQQYHPVRMNRSYCADVATELSELNEIPEITTERLVLSAITDADKKAYNKICLDDEHNKLWGYDYRTDCANPDEDYFVNVTKEDFASGTAVNWGIRVGGELVGEILLYDFDYHGGAQVGIRVAAKSGGHGYGREALRAVLPFGIYKLGLERITAKCFKENASSKRMLSAEMLRDGEDQTFYYFSYKV